MEDGRVRGAGAGCRGSGFDWAGGRASVLLGSWYVRKHLEWLKADLTVGVDSIGAWSGCLDADDEEFFFGVVDHVGD